MKAAVEFKAETRPSSGTGSARAARREGKTPVSVYAKGKSNLNLAIETRLLSNEYFRGGFMNKIVALKVDGKDVFAIPRDIQLNPVSDKIEHADFMAVDKSSVVKVRVPVHFSNAEKSIGIKRGGVLNIVAHDVELLCPVNSIPKAVDVDVATMDIGTALQLQNLALPEGVVPATKRVVTIASIAGRAKDDEPEAGAAAAAGAVPATKAAAAAAADKGGAKAPAKPAAKK